MDRRRTCAVGSRWLRIATAAIALAFAIGTATGAAESIPASYSAGAAFDDRRGVLVVFGGYRPGGGLNGETGEWNGFDWRRLDVHGPGPRQSAAMAFDPLRGVVVLFGGDNGAGPLGDTWEWDGSR